MKKRTVFTIIFVILVAAAIALGFYFLSKKEKEVPAEPKQAYAFIDEAYQKAARALPAKVYDTPIDGLFYSLSPVRFYGVKGGALAQIKKTETLRVSPVIAGKAMNFEMTVVTYAKQHFGVGVWQSDSGAYNDAFAVLEDMPAAFSSDYSYLLLIDTARVDSSANERMYSELFTVAKNGTVGGYLFPQNNRTTEPSGKLRTDWDCGTLQMVNSGYTLTGRKYNHADTAQKYDLRITSAGNTETVAREVTRFVLPAKNPVFIKTQEAGWSLHSLKAGKQTEISSFEGDIFKDYTVKNGFVVHKSKPLAVSINSGKEIKAVSSLKKLYSINSFAKKMVILGKEENKEGKDYKVQKLMVADSATKQASVFYANDCFDENSPVLLCSAGLITQKGGKSVFISYKALETLTHNVIQ